MSAKKNLVVLCAVLIVGATSLGFFLDTRERSPRTASTAKSSEGAVRIARKLSSENREHRIQALEDELEHLKRRAKTRVLNSQKIEQHRRNSKEDSAPEKLSPEQFAIKEEEAFDAIIDGIAEQFDQDRADAKATEIESQMRDYLLSQDFKGLSIESVECRSKQCQIIIGHQEPGSQEQLHKAWQADIFEHGAVVQYTEELSQTVVFAARESTDS